ncbi:hypothetical protein DFP72DRAFT_1043400 [Ephemerocybe angulata]|uniref:Uncharacterized protein n=1 Tax=Ephemerocybe angulata TaxID=980116 RepID=A0A8H6I6G5_9AGAR|nr:hypothetical protein DFP72DRAFT_1043400 [Tulosesus angulatus]
MTTRLRDSVRATRRCHRRASVVVVVVVDDSDKRSPFSLPSCRRREICLAASINRTHSQVPQSLHWQVSHALNAPQHEFPSTPSAQLPHVASGPRYGCFEMAYLSRIGIVLEYLKPSISSCKALKSTSKTGRVSFRMDKGVSGGSTGVYRSRAAARLVSPPDGKVAMPQRPAGCRFVAFRVTPGLDMRYRGTATVKSSHISSMSRLIPVRNGGILGLSSRRRLDEKSTSVVRARSSGCLTRRARFFSGEVYMDEVSWSKGLGPNTRNEARMVYCARRHAMPMHPSWLPNDKNGVCGPSVDWTAGFQLNPVSGLEETEWEGSGARTGLFLAEDAARWRGRMMDFWESEVLGNAIAANQRPWDVLGRVEGRGRQPIRGLGMRGQTEGQSDTRLSGQSAGIERPHHPRRGARAATVDLSVDAPLFKSWQFRGQISAIFSESGGLGRPFWAKQNVKSL